ncbi:MAG: type I-U CRISPR-associated protein Csx17, partial [Boseongicola sp. SB0670_bin_30]|nr:type I-U CRISPR-associated protein Csx17 [Boseongicola sp. SB0670_bin_30]
AKRFRLFAEAIRIASHAVSRHALAKPPKDYAKIELVSTLRAEHSDRALDWLDAAVSLSGSGLAYPSLLGTGGNDGRLDFTNNFMRRLVSRRRTAPGLFDASTGLPTVDAAPTLVRSLFDVQSRGLISATIGQFAPGAAGGPNGTSGFSTESLVNSWDFVLMLEGAIAFASAATRRHQGTSKSQASFPFSVRVVGAGWGGVDATDENDARSEFWAPLWPRRATYLEIGALLAEGRAVLRGHTARDGLEFARAATTLGVSRGITAFERYAFLKRAGDAHRATPLGRFNASTRPRTDLIADLEVGDWLENARRYVGGATSSAHAKLAMRRLQNALFQMTDAGQNREGTHNALVALGEFVRWMVTNRNARDALRRPPPVVSRAWMQAADDDSPEFRVAAALAGLGLAGLREPGKVSVATGAIDDPAGAKNPRRAPPMAAHLAPIDEGRYPAARRSLWSVNATNPNVVWGTGSLVTNMIAVLERRLVEATIRGLPDKPFSGAVHARLEDVAAFLSGDFDDSRCAALLAGLIWVRPAHLRMNTNAPASPVAFAYAALKPIFTPDDALRRIGVLTGTERLPVPPELAPQLRAGGDRRDGRTSDTAVRIALARARGSGIPSLFDSAQSGGRPGTTERSRHGAGISSERLAAALLIPIGDHSLKFLANRAYPGVIAESST